MPTARTAAFILTGGLLYLFANQTQVGWLYVMSAVLFSVVVVAYILNRRALWGIAAARQVGASEDAALHESDEVTVHLVFHNRWRTPAAHIETTEICPLVEPDQREHPVFIPMLPGKNSVQLAYDITLERRGVYAFPPLNLISRAPFGLFRKRHTLDVLTRVLVYPEVRQLKRLSLLERQPAAQLPFPRSGYGSEVIGVRPFRTGDSPRHIHWRSVARTGRLISKEFAEETHPGLTLVIDRYYPLPNETKHTAFEWGIKAAASIADYAVQRGYPLYVLADETNLPTPSGALEWDSLLQYLARVSPLKQSNLREQISGRALQQYIALILPTPHDEVVTTAVGLRQRGYQLMAVLPDPATFPEAGDSAEGAAGQLAAAGIETRRLIYGEDWAEQLVNSL